MNPEVKEDQRLPDSGNNCGASKPKWFSVGIVPTGVISIGVVPMGIISIGVVPMGIVSLGLVSMGTIATGLVSMGLLTFGKVTMGLVQPGAPVVETGAPAENHRHHNHH
ncbi:MAG: hypothetical protein N5P05_001251 [Chroococcopsis gigantea SAG 12.99]|jgi:hypothetical protein|nr:hypothetical protein [Chlorogloea purpurea SAG 13.99]MDV2999645.1 hypothetical protein [Chroococcopsis gigantea SAG 12.99]